MVCYIGNTCVAALPELLAWNAISWRVSIRIKTKNDAMMWECCVEHTQNRFGNWDCGKPIGVAMKARDEVRVT